MQKNKQESISQLCTGEMIDFYDCAYPPGTESDLAMKDQMWQINLGMAQKSEANRQGGNQSEQDFLNQISKVSKENDQTSGKSETGGEEKVEGETADEDVKVELPNSQNDCTAPREALSDCVAYAKKQ